MQDTVSVPSSPSGWVKVMQGSWAARALRASTDRRSPGRIMPPRNMPPDPPPTGWWRCPCQRPPEGAATGPGRPRSPPAGPCPGWRRHSLRWQAGVEIPPGGVRLLGLSVSSPLEKPDERQARYSIERKTLRASFSRPANMCSVRLRQRDQPSTRVEPKKSRNIAQTPACESAERKHIRMGAVKATAAGSPIAAKNASTASVTTVAPTRSTTR